MIEYIKWDSSFFKMKVGKIIVEKQDFFFAENIADYDLIYVFSNRADLQFNLVDRKVVYLIDNLQDLNIDNIFSAEFYNADKDNYADILNLTLQSGVYSRFKKDANFKNNEYQKLYTEWINKSISKEIASDIIVKRESGGIIGFATISQKMKSLPILVWWLWMRNIVEKV